MGKFSDKAKESTEVSPSVDSTTSTPTPEVDNKLSTPTPDTETSPKTETAPKTEEVSKPFDLDEWLGTIPDEAKNGINERASTNFQNFINQKYGDIMPLIEEIENDPTLIKQLSKLTNKELRDFVFNDAYGIFEGTPAPVKETPQIPKEFEDKVTALETKIERQERETQEKAYVASRQQELTAMLTEYPELRFQKQDKSDPAYRLGDYLINLAEERTARNFAKGINKTVSYREVYEEYRSLQNNTPPQSIPNTTPSGPPKTQAPTNIVESKQRFLEEVKKAGGFGKYSQTVTGRKNK